MFRAELLNDFNNVNLGLPGNQVAAGASNGFARISAVPRVEARTAAQPPTEPPYPVWIEGEFLRQTGEALVS